MNFTQKKSAVRKLVENCPQEHKGNLKCPLRNVRKLTPLNQGHYINSLSEIQLAHILTYHENCLEIAAALSSNTPALTEFSIPSDTSTH